MELQSFLTSLKKTSQDIERHQQEAGLRSKQWRDMRLQSVLFACRSLKKCAQRTLVCLFADMENREQISFRRRPPATQRTLWVLVASLDLNVLVEAVDLELDPHNFPRISSPFSFFAFLACPLFSTNQANQFFFCWGPNSSQDKVVHVFAAQSADLDGSQQLSPPRANRVPRNSEQQSYVCKACTQYGAHSSHVFTTTCFMVRTQGQIGVLFGCFGRKIDGLGLPGGLIIYQGPDQGHLLPLKGRL